MTPTEVATAFTDMLKRGEHREAGARFNAPDIVSIESMTGPMARVEGAEAVEAKGAWWYAHHDIHEATAEGPFVNGDQFVVRFQIDVTFKDTGARMQMTEAGLYTVRDGRIAEERFFNTPS